MPDLALVYAVIAHAARWTGRGDTVVAVVDGRRAYFYAEEKRGTFVELPDYARGKAAESVVRDSVSCRVMERQAEKRTCQLRTHGRNCVAMLLP